MKLKKAPLVALAIYSIFLVLLSASRSQGESENVHNIAYWKEALILLAGPLNLIWMDPVTVFYLLGYRMLLFALIPIVLISFGILGFHRSVLYKMTLILGMLAWFTLGAFFIIYSTFSV